MRVILFWYWTKSGKYSSYVRLVFVKHGRFASARDRFVLLRLRNVFGRRSRTLHNVNVRYWNILNASLFPCNPVVPFRLLLLFFNEWIYFMWFRLVSYCYLIISFRRTRLTFPVRPVVVRTIRWSRRLSCDRWITGEGCRLRCSRCGARGWSEDGAGGFLGKFLFGLFLREVRSNLRKLLVCLEKFEVSFENFEFSLQNWKFF